jgi:hypothetical protein
MAAAAPHHSTRKSIRKVILYAILLLLAGCLVSGAAVYFTLPYGIAGELFQIAGEMAYQRFFAAAPQPVTFPDGLAVEGAHIAGQVDPERLMADLNWLADDARQGRKAGSASEDEVGAWIMERMQSLGLRPFEEAGLKQYAQVFDGAAPGEKAENIIGVLPGADENLPLRERRFLLVGAHYDHLGVGEDGQVYNGADDDATGTSAVLEIARLLSSGPRPQETVVFVLFSGEEGGRRGSSALGRILRAKGLTSRVQFLNLEVFGALPGKGTYLDVWDEESHTTPVLVAAVQAAGEALDIPIQRKGRDPSSDATRLLAYGIPSVTVDVAWEGGKNHPDMQEDDVSAIDPEGFFMGARAAAASVWVLANDGQ